MNNKKTIYIVILTILLLIIMQNIVLAKYYTNINVKAIGNIALQVISISKEEKANKTRKITKLDETEFILYVTNFETDRISQVGQEYYLKFYSDDVDISKFNITITKDNKEVKVNNGITETANFIANQKETHKYNVIINANGVNESTKGKIKVALISEQVQPI